MRRAIRFIAAAIAVTTAAGAAAYVRETTTPGFPATGHHLWWRGRTVPYRVNATSVVTQNGAPAPCQDPALAVTTVQQALATWGTATSGGGSACTDFQFVPSSVSTTTQTAIGNDCVNLIVFRATRCRDVAPGDPCHGTVGGCITKYNCWDTDVNGSVTIGLTTATFDPATGEIVDADMELWGWSGQTGAQQGYYFTCPGPGFPACPSASPPYTGDTNCNLVDVGAVATHEAGHMLGLDHVCDPSFPVGYNSTTPGVGTCPAQAAVMQPSVGDPAFRILGPDDVTAICAVYPKGGPTLTSIVVPDMAEAALTCGPQQSHKSGGCSSASGAGIAGLLAVLFAVRLRRRAH